MLLSYRCMFPKELHCNTEPINSKVGLKPLNQMCKLFKLCWFVEDLYFKGFTRGGVEKVRTLTTVSVVNGPILTL